MELDTGLETKEQVINKATDIAYQVFQEYGWEYYDGAPDWNRIKKTIEELISSAIVHGMAETGRIVVQKREEDVSIMLDLGKYYIEPEWDE